MSLFKSVDPNLKIGLHSLRSGGVSTAANSDINDRCLKRYGRWKTDFAKVILMIIHQNSLRYHKALVYRLHVTELTHISSFSVLCNLFSNCFIIQCLLTLKMVLASALLSAYKCDLLFCLRILDRGFISFRL